MSRVRTRHRHADDDGLHLAAVALARGRDGVQAGGQVGLFVVGRDDDADGGGHAQTGCKERTSALFVPVPILD